MPMPMKPIIQAKPVQASIQKPISPKPLAPASQAAPLVSQPSIQTTVRTKPVHRVTGMRTLKGGLKESHTAIITDRSDDRTQILPYHAHCLTCGFEAKSKDYQQAVSLASGHVGS